MTDLKAAVAGGQYDYPRGIFFGGHGPSQLHRILIENLPRWVGEARSVLHLDFHTGLGPWATYRLLLDPQVKPRSGRVGPADVRAGARRPLRPGRDLAYPTRGDIGTWCRSLFPDRGYDYVCAEFGTYPPLRMIAALRAENQAHHGLSPDDPASLRAKRRLKEVFAPSDPAWRGKTVSEALDLLDQARDAVFKPG